MSRPALGSVVLVDWRRGGFPKESNKLRPSIVVEDSQIFDDEHANVIVVPLTTDADFASTVLSWTFMDERDSDAIAGFTHVGASLGLLAPF